MTQWSGSTSEVLSRRERDYLLGSCKVKMRSSVEKLEVGDLR